MDSIVNNCNRFTDSEIENICKEYLENKNTCLLVNKYKITKIQEKEICRLYLEDKLSTWKIAPLFNVLNVCILKVLKRNNIILRKRTDAAKIYSVNRKFFETVDTPEKAYILGLCYSDGNVYKDSFTLYFQEQDKYILEEISKLIEFNGPLGFRPQKSIWSKISNKIINVKAGYALRIHDREFVSNLKNQGIIERKTSKLSFPYFLDKSLWPSFILGELDGDGCICIEKKSIRVNIAGSIYFTSDIKNISEKFFNIYCRQQLYLKSKGTTVNFSGRNAIKFLNILYKNPPKFFFKRKYLRYKNFITDNIKRENIDNDYRSIMNESYYNIIPNIKYV